MITLVVYVDGEPLILKSAINRGEANYKDFHRYVDEAGNFVLHKPEEGIVKLAKKLLDTWEAPDYT